MTVKKKLKRAAIFAVLGAITVCILNLIREVLRGRMSVDNVNTLNEGLKEARKANEEVLSTSKEASKRQAEIIKTREAEVRNMTMKEQSKLAKKMGLI